MDLRVDDIMQAGGPAEELDGLRAGPRIAGQRLAEGQPALLRQGDEVSKAPNFHFDARYGWFRFTPTGRIKSIVGEPFHNRDEAIAYALVQLQRHGQSIHSAFVNARRALEWAEAKRVK